jgi:divalent metal cation (Fe/Co/Zn/Cd) transporter
MWFPIHFKTKTGKALNSSAILADAACSRTCLYLSFSLLVASAGYELTGIGSFDAIGALLIAYFAFMEGREAFLRAQGLSCCCNGNCKD